MAVEQGKDKMAKLKCVECSATFTEREIGSDALLCPSCGGRLEDDTATTENGSRKKTTSHEQQNQSSTTNKIRTHYDNLKVARNAPVEVIRAAYRTLSQKYHPDLNQSNPDAAKIMRIINAAFEVLSDPEKRQAHDEWIAKQEKATPRTETSQNQTNHTSAPNYTRIPSKTTGDFLKRIGKNWLWYTLAGISLWGLATNKPSPPPSGPKPYQAAPSAPIKQAYVRTSAAPNGQPWPTSAAYIPGYQRHHTNGRSKVTVDNSQNGSEVFVKLVSIDSDKAYPVRTFYIPGHGSFTLNKVTSGSYDIRYRDLESGHLSRSEAFQLKENRTDDGVQFSNLTMTLYKVVNGNMQTYSLAEEEF